MPPKVSVVMSVYNGERYLGEAIESILNQTFTDFEFIVVDDASTDSTPGILELYAKRDGRIRLVCNNHNLGLTLSLNRGLELAQGKYLARHDADDVSLPERLKLQTHFFETHPEVGALGASAELIDERGRFVREKHPPIQHEILQAHLLLNNPLFHSTLMARRDLLDDLGGYDERLPYAQDYDLWWRLGRAARLASLPDVLVRGRLSGEMLSKLHRREQSQCALEVSLRAIRDSLCGKLLDEAAYRRFWWTYNGWAGWAYEGDKPNQLRRGDIQRLEPFWDLIATHPAALQIWGPQLCAFAHHLVDRRQAVQGIQLLWALRRRLGQPIDWRRLFEGLARPYVPRLGRKLWRAWQTRGSVI